MPASLIALCSFHSSRYPTKPSDTAKKFDASKHNHVVFVRKNKFYKVALAHNGRELSAAELEAQIEQVQGMLSKAYDANGLTGPRYNYFRPGSGFFSDHMRALVSKMGYRLVLGSIYPHDAQISYWWVNARHILSMLRPGGIIICHDRRSWTIPMLRKVLPEAKKRGYRLVTVTELVQAGEE